MKTIIKLITPDFASTILRDKNPNNRTLSPTVVEKYANDMAAGRWAITHQGIAFDLNGDLLDGQHRLAAVVRCGKPIEMMMTVGLDKSFPVNGHQISIYGMIDGLRPRKPAHMLQVKGFKNCNKIAAIARSMMHMCSSQARARGGVSATMTEELLRLTKGSISQVTEASAPKQILRLPACMLAPIAFFHTTQPEKAIEFIIECEAVSGAKGSASRSLASWKTNHSVAEPSQQSAARAVAASALCYWVEGKTVDRLCGGKEGMEWLLGTNPNLQKAIRNLDVLKQDKATLL